MPLVNDPALVKMLAGEKMHEFHDLKQKIKSIRLSEFDALAHPVVTEVTNKIDCTICGNCCKVQEPGVTMQEVEVLANLAGTPIEKFKNENLAFDSDGVSFLCHKPCVFLNTTVCSVYEHRPLSCADYPGLHRPRLKWRIKQLEENYSICPIVYNVVEIFKKALE